MMHSTANSGRVFERTYSKRLGNSPNVESVPLNLNAVSVHTAEWYECGDLSTYPCMKTTTSFFDFDIGYIT